MEKRGALNKRQKEAPLFLVGGYLRRIEELKELNELNSAGRNANNEIRLAGR